MTLPLRRRPRVLYRVYPEEEYLNGAGSGLASVGDEWSLGESAVADEWPLVDSPLDPPVDEWPLAVEPVGQEVVGDRQLRSRVMGEHRLHRMAGVAMLASAVVTVCGVVFLNIAGIHGRGIARRGSFVAAMRSRVVSSPVVSASHAAPSRLMVVRPPKTTGSLVRRTEHRRGSGSRQLVDLSPRSHRSIAVVADYVPRSPTGGSAALGAQAVAPAPPRPAPEARPEFGFER
jgi:hypothetical protein